ncbi:MAG: hypothetical protein MUE33_08855 [Cytophagaceae bacterium]|jgi:hypothetical protein|nr:hypothetical protein [Cytophagaceae bacterium]
MNKLFIPLIFLVSVTTFGQQGSVQDATFDVVVVGDLELQPANRFFEQNGDVQPVPDIKPQQYDARDYTINPPRFDAKVAIPKMPEDSINAIQNNYIKVGFGNYTTPYLDAYVHNKRSKTWSVGAHARHYSSAKGVLNNSGISQQLIEGFVSRIGKTNKWSSHVSYSRDRYFYYGLPQDIIVDKDTIRQLYQLFHGQIATHSIQVGKSFQYSTGIDLFYLTTSRNASEFELLWKGKGTYKINDERSVKLESYVSNASKKDSSDQNRLLIYCRPVYQISKTNYILQVGATFNYSSDTLKGSDGVHVYPYAHFDYFYQPGKLTFFGGLNGQLQNNTYRSMVQLNPYLGQNSILANANNTIEFYAGAKGNISKKVNYKTQFSFASYKNQYFFTNSIVDSSQFELLYDRGTTSLIALKGQLFYDLSKTWRTYASLEWNQWTTDQLQKAWHRPSFFATAGASYNASNKIIIRSELYYIGGIQAWNRQTNREVELKNIIDLSIQAEYRFSSDFAAFIEFNNILAQKYQRYLYYTQKSINVLAGFTYSF